MLARAGKPQCSFFLASRAYCSNANRGRRLRCLKCIKRNSELKFTLLYASLMCSIKCLDFSFLFRLLKFKTVLSIFTYMIRKIVVLVSHVFFLEWLRKFACYSSWGVQRRNLLALMALYLLFQNSTK